MQKVSILIFSLFAVLSATAQNAIVIDNNKKHQSIFDGDDPLSFISLVRSNSYNIGYMEIEGMSQEARASLSEKDKENITQFIGKPGTVPLIDADPESPNFGNPLIVTNPETGMQSFIYDAPDTVFTMLDNIDRIVIYLENGDGPALERATRLSYFKLIDGAYHSVLSVNAQDVLSFDGFSYYRQLDDKLTSELLSHEPTSMRSVMRKEALKQKEMYDGSKFARWRYDLKQNYFPADGILFGFYSWGKMPVNMEKWEAERDVMYPRLSSKAEDAQYPFGLHLGSGIVQDTAGRAALLAGFDEVHSDFEVSDKPLIDNDPNSPTFGLASIVVNPDGSESVQYPAPKEVFFWLEYSNAKMFVKESFHSVDNTSETTVDAIYFTTKVDGQEEVISVMPFRESFQEYFVDHEKLTLNEMSFYKTLVKAFKNKKLLFDLTDPATQKELKM